MFCECGCGLETSIVKTTSRRLGLIKGQPRRFRVGHAARGRRNGKWTDGRRIHNNAYVTIKRPDHPNANGLGYVPEHVLVAEKALGHVLPDGAVVHHHDGNGFNNDPSNLVICENQSYHVLIHARQRMLNFGADPDAEAKCSRCGLIKPLDSFYKKPRWNGRASHCADCDTAQRRKKNRSEWLNEWLPDDYDIREEFVQ